MDERTFWPPAALRPDTLGQLYNEAYEAAIWRGRSPKDAHQAACFAVHEQGYKHANAAWVAQTMPPLCTLGPGGQSCTDGRCLSVDTKASSSTERT